MKKIIVGVTGASGTIYAIALLQALQARSDVETHLVLSAWAQKNLALETTLTLTDVKSLADFNYSERDQGAKIASGSFLNDGMIVVPASMKTVAGIACGFADNLIGRAADVALKERRKLIIVPRETPLSTIHLENLLKLSRLGAQIIPPIPAFYNQPKTINDIVNHTTMKLLDAVGISTDISPRWQGD
ncbi:UbiX family flavin prenyltransferase [Loigolactobacillus backii]|uniref:Flavin prenyltransferase UbiX n=1 Tax=Loigolactobacillus backii TaxID=375175 RepID=A0A192H0Q9_9LACO|nr:UbiX family flavin prenyltransferase [Loigolactobacillus backii]ANK61940.1 3-octaprenyl-4-hydroxybenzoate carboxy-lyase [Loigolactobacillus backii]ANK68866.1 3-octaprenyl-4-hydroxybenzoate carboxy-lyase [Loigolactobacillus backii]MDA5386864.1 UbiX family flavin prenyltransferase [Loigolactobacillus backii]MDA5389351.1 UbiX family flavin prenyltransferase [Loigolactobacillus backii]PIO82456.1 3-octaprenyl-4-hydroxybenzoate carboxy-lyase [Loigolactobacillus backii]